MQPAFRHPDPGVARHQVIGVLDPAVALRAGELRIFFFVNAVELEDPVLEPLLGIDLSRPELARLRIEGQHGLGPCAAGGGTHGEDVFQSRAIIRRSQPSVQTGP